MPLSSKFFTEPTGEKIVKIGQYLAKIWKKYNSLLFGPPCTRRSHYENKLLCNLHTLSQKQSKLFWHNFCQISTNFDNFWQKDGQDDIIV